MKYGFIYETTNILTGHKYIGQHRRSHSNANDPDDSWYLGSGKLLGNAINKYGESNFERVILEECDSAEKLNERELYHIKLRDAVNSHDYYNLSDAPQTGFPVTKGMNLPDYWRENLSKSQKERASRDDYENIAKNPEVAKKISDTMKEGYASGRIKKLYGGDNPASREEVRVQISSSTKEAMARPEVKEKSLAKGRRLSQDKEFSRKISEGRIGVKNPCYGKLWINNGEYNKRVSKEEFEKIYSSQGFIEGRLSKPYGKRK